MNIRVVKGFEGRYEVSDTGKVYTCERVIEQIIKSRNQIVYYHKKRRELSIVTMAGYSAVVLYKNSKRYNYKVHRLVAEAFIPNPENKPEVNHLDGNKQNNNVWNLEWVTREENEQHAHRTGLKINPRHVGEKHPNAIVTEKEVLEIRKLWKENPVNGMQPKIARMFNISNKNVSCIVTRKTWKHI